MIYNILVGYGWVVNLSLLVKQGGLDVCVGRRGWEWTVVHCKMFERLRGGEKVVVSEAFFNTQ